jgi:hypothetical protein
MRVQSLLAAAIALLTVACDRYPPTAGYVTEPPPPATPRIDIGTSNEVDVTEHTAVGIVFLVNDKSTFSGTRPGTAARSLDEGVARVVPTTRTSTVNEGAGSYTGPVFVVDGVGPGDTAIEVFENDESMGTIPVHVLVQE